jgi:hypothetical protein
LPFVYRFPATAMPSIIPAMERITWRFIVLLALAFAVVVFLWMVSFWAVGFFFGNRAL